MAKSYKINNSIALIDDHAIIRKALVGLLSTYNDFSILFDVGNFKDLVTELKDGKIPDVLLMDINMPEKNGFEVAAWMRDEYPQVKILALSSEADGFSIAKVMRKGAKGFISKSCNPPEVLLAINTVMKGDSYLSQHDFNEFNNAIQHSNYFINDNVEFTEKERELLPLLCTSLSYKEIGEKMLIGIKSVENHRDSMYKKIGIHTRHEIVVYAIKNKLVNL